jgi:hypothetical protein
LLNRMFYGRYGIKGISKLFLVLALVSYLMGSLSVGSFTYGGNFLGPLVLVAFALWRAFSRNIEKRRMEDAAFTYMLNNAKARLKGWYNRQKHRFSAQGRRQAGERKKQNQDFAVFKCPRCRQQLRAPKGKGRIRVTCTQCKHVFERKV